MLIHLPAVYGIDVLRQCGSRVVLPHGQQSLRYLLPGPLQKQFVDPWLDDEM